MPDGTDPIPQPPQQEVLPPRAVETPSQQDTPPPPDPRTSDFLESVANASDAPRAIFTTLENEAGSPGTKEDPQPHPILPQENQTEAQQIVEESFKPRDILEKISNTPQPENEHAEEPTTPVETSTPQVESSPAEPQPRFRFEQSIRNIKILLDAGESDISLETQMLQDGMTTEQVKQVLEQMRDQAIAGVQKIDSTNPDADILSRISELSLSKPEEIEQLNALLSQATDTTLDVKGAIEAIKHYQASGRSMIDQFHAQKMGTKGFASTSEALDALAVLQQNIRMLSGRIGLGRFRNKEEIAEIEREQQELEELIATVNSVDNLETNPEIGIPQNAEKMADDISITTAGLAMEKMLDFYAGTLREPIAETQSVSLTEEEIQAICDKKLERDFLSKLRTIQEDADSHQPTQDEINEALDILRTAQGLTAFEAATLTPVDRMYSTSVDIQLEARRNKLPVTLMTILDYNKQYGTENQLRLLTEYVAKHQSIPSKQENIEESETARAAIWEIAIGKHYYDLKPVIDKVEELDMAKKSALDSIHQIEQAGSIQLGSLTVTRDFFDALLPKGEIPSDDATEMKRHLANIAIDGIVARAIEDQDYSVNPEELLAIPTEDTLSYQAMLTFSRLDRDFSGSYQKLQDYLHTLSPQEYDQLISKGTSSTKTFFELIKNGPEKFRREDYAEDTFSFTPTDHSIQVENSVVDIIANTINVGSLERQRFALSVLAKIQGDHPQTEDILKRCIEDQKLRDMAIATIGKMAGHNPNAINPALEAFESMGDAFGYGPRQQLESILSKMLKSDEQRAYLDINRAAGVYGTTSEKLNQIITELDEVALYKWGYDYQFNSNNLESPKEKYFREKTEVFFIEFNSVLEEHPEQARKDSDFLIDFLKREGNFGASTPEEKDFFFHAVSRLGSIVRRQQHDSHAYTLSQLSAEIAKSMAGGVNSQGILNFLEKGPFNVTYDEDIEIGKALKPLEKSDNSNWSIVSVALDTDLQKIESLMAAEDIQVNDSNWQTLLSRYIALDAGFAQLNPLTPESAEKLKELFKDPKAKDVCLNNLNRQWQEYLRRGYPEEFPGSLMILTELIKVGDGAGPLTQIESISRLITECRKNFSNDPSGFVTTTETMTGLMNMEKRFASERWSNEDKTEFYNISRSIMKASPGIFADYLNLFSQLTPSQMKEFARTVYPLYRTKLTLSEQRDGNGNTTFETDQLMDLRTDIRQLPQVLQTTEKPFELKKDQLFSDITTLFRDRLGIIKVPENFTPENIRSLSNISMYLGNLNERNPAREATLGFFLGLKINGDWDRHRQGQPIDPSEYMTSHNAAEIATMLRTRQELNPITPEILGLTPEELPEFQELLQQESQNIAIGNIETIDIKLANIISNLKGLEDPDLYPEQLDKDRLQLLLKWGNKSVGKVAAGMYQGLSGKQPKFSDEDEALKVEIQKSMEANGLSLTPENIKLHFQEGIKPLSTVVNLLTFVDGTNAEDQIEELRTMLKPTDEVIKIFTRLGEDFQPESGAMALTQDLDFLENIVVKREAELDAAEKEQLNAYIGQIRSKMVDLESVYETIKTKFGGLKQGRSTDTEGGKNPLLAEKLAEIERIINTQNTAQTITSTMTHDMNAIIENIRECLSCKTSGANNDTNLTFGDSNKFFIYSSSETQQKGSMSDQIIFVEPITEADGTKSLAFVMDRVYGVHTPTILKNHIDTVLKKYKLIKQKFPNVNLKFFVTNAAIATGSISPESLADIYTQQKVNTSIAEVSVDVVKSAMGDHYIEFGGAPRSTGPRNVKGILITL